MGDAWTVDDPILQGTLRRFTASLCPSPGFAPEFREDVVAECNRRLVEKGAWPDGRPRTFVVSYLWQMVTNVRREQLRRLRSHFQAPLGERADGERKDVVDPSPSPEKVLEAAELGRAIRDCLQEMNPSYRHSVVLHLAGFRHAEIADRMGWKNAKSSENRVLRGLQALRRCLISKGFGMRGERG